MSIQNNVKIRLYYFHTLILTYIINFRTQNTNIRVQSAATPVIRSGAMRGSRRTLNVVTLSTSIQNSSLQSSLSKPPPPSSASLRNNIVVSENTGENSFREIPLRRVQSSMELRNLTFQTWCERRGKQYLKEKRLEQLKRLQEEEEAKKLVGFLCKKLLLKYHCIYLAYKGGLD